MVDYNEPIDYDALGGGGNRQVGCRQIVSKQVGIQQVGKWVGT